MPASLLTRQLSEMEITPFQLMMMPLSHTAGWARHLSEMEITSFQLMMMPLSHQAGLPIDTSASRKEQSSGGRGTGQQFTLSA